MIQEYKIPHEELRAQAEEIYFLNIKVDALLDSKIEKQKKALATQETLNSMLSDLQKMICKIATIVL